MHICMRIIYICCSYDLDLDVPPNNNVSAAQNSKDNNKDDSDNDYGPKDPTRSVLFTLFLFHISPEVPFRLIHDISLRNVQRTHSSAIKSQQSHALRISFGIKP